MLRGFLLSKFATGTGFSFAWKYIINISAYLHINEGGHGMEEDNRIILLEKENAELRADVEMLFDTVVQMKESLNLLVSRYIASEKT
jgi:hypothetical protein